MSSSTHKFIKINHLELLLITRPHPPGTAFCGGEIRSASSKSKLLLIWRSVRKKDLESGCVGDSGGEPLSLSEAESVVSDTGASFFSCVCSVHASAEGGGEREGGREGEREGEGGGRGGREREGGRGREGGRQREGEGGGRGREGGKDESKR